MAVFTRDEEVMYSIPLSFAEEHLKMCPFCCSEKPSWLTKKEWKFMGNEYYFKCPQCGSIITISEHDVTGLSFTTESFAGKIKKHQGKDNNRIYVRIVRIGDSTMSDGKNFGNKELPLDELFAIVE